MGVSSPTGSISVVTTAKVDRLIAMTGRQSGLSGLRTALSVFSCGIVASPFCGRGDMTVLAGAINRIHVEGLGTKWTQ
ncbi:hypothetical protein D3C85_1709190 [compost metagenome]